MHSSNVVKALDKMEVIKVSQILATLKANSCLQSLDTKTGLRGGCQWLPERLFLIFYIQNYICCKALLIFRSSAIAAKAAA